MKHILIIVFVLTGVHVNGQYFSVSGTVKADINQEPISGATVFIEELNLRTETDSSGFYEMAVPAGFHEIQVFSLGMAATKKTIRVQNDLVVNFSIKEFTNNLEGVEVRDRRETNGISRLRSVEGFGIYEAKKNELIVLDDFAANKVNNNARQVFAKVPGLNIWESDYAGLQLDIAARGLGPSRTANFNTRQNGYDMSADALGYPESYYMPAMQAVERIEIVRGAASLQYGTQFGGMLNFKLKEAPDKPFELNFEQATGSFGMLNSYVSVGGKSKKIDFFGYYQYRQGDGWRENSGFDSHLAFGRLGFQLSEKLKLGFEYSFLNYEAQQPGGLTDQQFNAGDIEQSRRGRNWFQVDWNLVASTLDYKFSNRTKLNIRSFGLFSSRDALGNLNQISVPDNPNAERTLIRDQFKNFGSEARLLHRYSLKGKNAVFLAGVRYYNGFTDRRQGNANNESGPSFEFLNPEDPENFDYDFPSQNISVFVENLIDITPRLSITPGLRFEHIRTDSKGNWKQYNVDFAGNIIGVTENNEERSDVRSFLLKGIGASYYLSDDLSLYSNLSENFRSITFSDLRVENPNFLLDSLITDESGYNMDIGIRGKLTPWLDIDMSLFLMRYNNRIDQYEFPGSTVLFRTNVGDSRHIGIESFAEVDLMNLLKTKNAVSQLSLFANLALTSATYVRSAISSIRNREVAYVPDIMLRTGLNYSWKALKATYQFSYLSQQFSDATNSTFNPNALTGIIPSYYVMDVSFAYEPGRYKFTFGVNNLTNESYFTRRAESYPGPGIIPATPRSFYISAGITL